MNDSQGHDVPNIAALNVVDNLTTTMITRCPDQTK